jgi:hypothetical protein
VAIMKFEIESALAPSTPHRGRLCARVDRGGVEGGVFVDHREWKSSIVTMIAD